MKEVKADFRKILSCKGQFGNSEIRISKTPILQSDVKDVSALSCGYNKTILTNGQGNTNNFGQVDVKDISNTASASPAGIQ